MNCKNCGAPLVLVWEKEFFLCEYCKTLHFPEANKDYTRSLEKPTDITCPICHEPLVQALLDQTRVLHCTKCKGILVDTFAFFPTILFIRGRTSGPDLALYHSMGKSLKENCPALIVSNKWIHILMQGLEISSLTPVTIVR